ncbi:MAG TPA: hypothetical protein VMG38_17475 [Trebonia sp.]|nr:hypothetical protein [Trebonia sp.]
MSTLPATRLERRARLLLRAYPPEYRAERAEEMLGTLLEAAQPGQEWPSARDAWSLLRSGVNARAARNRRLGLRISLRQAAAFGLALYVSVAAVNVGSEVPPWGTDPAQTLAVALLLAATVLAVWTGYRAAVATITAIAIAIFPYGSYRSGHGFSLPYHLTARMASVDAAYFGPPLLALLALIALTQRSERPPRSWLLLACLPSSLLGARQLLPDPGWHRLSGLVTLYPLRTNDLPVLLTLLTLLTLGWLVTDTRPALGVALSLVVGQLALYIPAIQEVVMDRAPIVLLWTWDTTIFKVLGLAAAMVATTLLILHRRTRASRATAG